MGFSRRILLFFGWICCAVRAFAGSVSGTIADSSGQPLGFATVYVQGTTRGTAAGADGRYLLQLPEGSYTIVAQFIGYRQERFTCNIRGDERLEHNFVLGEQGGTMQEVVVKANSEDPAYRILREAIRRRRRHLDEVSRFRTGIYLKGVLKSTAAPDKLLGDKVDKTELGLDTSGKGVLYLCEEFADYFQDGSRSRTVVRSVRESGDPQGLGFSELPSVVSFYENSINLFGRVTPRGLISPVSERALFYYRYKLLGEFREDGQLIYKIQVIPKRPFEPLVSGIIYITDESFALHSLRLGANTQSTLNLLDTLTIEQVYLPLAGTWVIKNQVIRVGLNTFGFSINGNFATVYDRQVLGEPIPDSLADSKTVSRYDKSATQQDSSFWNAARPLQLEADEQRDYHLKDSIRILREDPEFIDSVRRDANKKAWNKVLYRNVVLNDSGYRDRLALSRVLDIVGFNTVEGLVVAPRAVFTHNTDSFNSLRLKAAARYSAGIGEGNGMAALGFQHQSRRWYTRGYSVELEGGRYYFQDDPSQPIYPLFNTVSSLVFGRNYLKLYRATNAAASFAFNRGNGFSGSLRLSYEDRFFPENATDYSWAGSERIGYTSNIPAIRDYVFSENHVATNALLVLSYQPGVTYVDLPDSRYPQRSRAPRLTLTYEKGIPGVAGGSTDFDRISLELRHTLRLRLLGRIQYRLEGGGFWNSAFVGIPDLVHLHGNRVAIAGNYLESFQTAPYYDFSSAPKYYAKAHLEYHLEGLLTNKLPVLRKADLHLVIGANLFQADANRYFREVFIGFDNLGVKPLRIFRLDLNASEDYLGMRRFGIRLGVSTQLARLLLGPNERW